MSSNMSGRFSYRSLRTFFRKKVQQQIRATFKSCCVLCTEPLGPDEGICVPIVQDMRMKISAESRRFAGSGNCDMKAAINGLLSCDACCKFLASPDSHQDVRLSALVPCLPILNYIDGVIHTLPDEDLAETMDQILEDLEKHPSLTPERRAAAPFLHCYQLQPVSRHGGDLPKDFTTVSLYDPPASTVINGRSYRIFDSTEVDTSTGNERLSRTMELPVYEQTASDTVTLWRIRQRPVGYFLGCFASLGIPEVGDLQLRKTFLSMFFHMVREDERWLCDTWTPIPFAESNPLDFKVQVSDPPTRLDHICLARQSLATVRAVSSVCAYALTFCVT